MVDAAQLAFMKCVERLELLLEKETRALKDRAPIDFEEFNERKTRALLEFSRASRTLPARPSLAIEKQLTRLQAKLAENASMLEHHLKATREIADLMVRTIEMAESDGTYSARRR